MGKTVGYIISKTSGTRYAVKWSSEEKQAWIRTEGNAWEIACENVTETEAKDCAQAFIDSQPHLY